MKMIGAAIVALVMFATSAMAWHTPCVSVSYGRAQRLAEKDMVKVSTPDGPRWLDKSLVAALGDPMTADPNQILKMDAQKRILAETRGLDEDQIAKIYNSSGVTVAKVGDWIITTAVGAGLTYVGIKASDGGGSKTKTTKITKTTQTQDNHAVTQTYTVTAGDGSVIAIGNNAPVAGNGGVVGEAGVGGASTTSRRDTGK